MGMPHSFAFEAFTQKYQCHRLVYYESYQDVQVAIAREKQLKRWRREKKIALIEERNPRWQDLAENWGRENSGTDGTFSNPPADYPCRRPAALPIRAKTGRVADPAIRKRITRR